MTRETIKEYILQVKSQDGTEALYNRWEPDILVEVINEIFNDHEAQLKAKDEEIERLKAESKQAYIEGSKSCDDLFSFYITKIVSLEKKLKVSNDSAIK